MSVNTITQFPFADPVPGLAGQLIRADDTGYDQARQAWNLTIDQRPDAVVLPESAADVAAAVRYARSRGLRVAVQGTGHNASPLGDLAGTLLVRTVRMREVLVNCRVANWKRSLNNSSLSSCRRASGLASGAAVFF